MIPGYQKFNSPIPAMPAKVARIRSDIHKTNGNPSKVSGIQHDKKRLFHIGAYMRKARKFDRLRPLYENACPGENPCIVEDLYATYIRQWVPDHPGELPAIPPNTRNNRLLWQYYFEKIRDNGLCAEWI
mgnify:FL=1